MDQLLRDGGDLDSMDRSLLDYNAMKNINSVKCSAGNNSAGAINNVTTNENGLSAGTPTGLLGSPPALLSDPSNHSTNSFNPSLTPVTPPVSPCSPLPPPPILQDGAQQSTTNDLLMDTGNVVKKDLVVRFTEQQNAVQHVTSTMSSKNSDYQNPAYNSGGK